MFYKNWYPYSRSNIRDNERGILYKSRTLLLYKILIFRIVPTILICLLSFSNIRSQEGGHRLTELNVSGYSTISNSQSICYDNQGILWSASTHSVHVYDGIDIKELPQLSAYTKTVISNIFKDHKGNIWVVYSKSASTPDNQIRVEKPDIHAITIVDAQNYDTMDVETYLKKEFDQNISIDQVFHRKSGIYIISNDDIYLINETMKKIPNNHRDTKIIGVTKDLNLIHCAKDTCYIINSDTNQIENKINSEGTTKYYLNYRSGDILMFDLSSKNIQSLYHKDMIFKWFNYPNASLDAIRYSSNSDQYLLYSDKVFYKQNGKTQELKFDNNETPKLILQYQKDDHIVLTNKSIYSLKTNFFKKLDDSSRAMEVRSLFISEDIQCYNSDNKEKIIKNGNSPPFIKTLAHAGIALDYYQDPLDSNVIWSSIYNQACELRKIDFAKEKQTCYPIRDCRFTIRSRYTNKLYHFSENDIILIDDASNDMTYYNIKLKGSLDNIGFNHIISDTDSTYILATDSGLLYMSEHADGSITTKYHTDTTYTHLDFLHKDKNDPNLIWVASEKVGLLQLNIKESSLTEFYKNEELANQTVHAIYEDSRNRLWFSTNLYLHCYDKNTDEIIYISAADGLSNNEFNKNSFFYDTLHNHIYLGGIDGYDYFNPDQINIDSTTFTDINILSMNILSNDGTIRSIINYKEGDVLKLDENEYLIELTVNVNPVHAAINSKINSNTYSYQLSLHDNVWIDTDSPRLKIPKPKYGRQSISIAANRYKTTQSNTLQIEIDVVRPFYKHYWFYIILYVALLLMTLGLMKLYSKALILQNKSLEEKIKKRTLELEKKNETQNKIFTILSHDMQSPVLSLNYFAKNVKALIKNNNTEDLIKFAENSQHQTQALYTNLNNILYWAQDDLNQLKFSPTDFNLRSTLLEIFSIYIHDLQNKNIKSHVDISEHIMVYTDKKSLQTILRNIISNAIKFSPNHSLIKITVTQNHLDQIVLNIIDSGPGINNNEEEDCQNKGWGLGLTISSQLARANGLTLSFLPNKPIGTNAQIVIPSAK